MPGGAESAETNVLTDLAYFLVNQQPGRTGQNRAEPGKWCLIAFWSRAEPGRTGQSRAEPGNRRAIGVDAKQNPVGPGKEEHRANVENFAGETRAKSKTSKLHSPEARRAERSNLSYLALHMLRQARNGFPEYTTTSFRDGSAPTARPAIPLLPLQDAHVQQSLKVFTQQQSGWYAVCLHS